MRDTSEDIQDRIGVILSARTPGVSNWRHVGSNYEIDSAILNSLEGDRGRQVLDMILTKFPDLTVFEFCEFLKTQNHMKLVKELEGQLFVEQKLEKQVEERENSHNGKRLYYLMYKIPKLVI